MLCKKSLISFKLPCLSACLTSAIEARSSTAAEIDVVGGMVGDNGEAAEASCLDAQLSTVRNQIGTDNKTNDSRC